MMDNINLVIICVIFIVILLFVASLIVFLYKVFNDIKQKKYKILFEDYNKQILEVITGKINELNIKNFDILCDAVILNFSWLYGEEKKRLYDALKKTEFFDYAFKKILRSGKSKKLKYAKTLSIVCSTEELRVLTDISLKNPLLVDVTAEAIFRNIDEAKKLEFFKPYLKLIISNISKYSEAVRRKLEFYAVLGGTITREVIMDVIKGNPDEKVLLSCLNIFSETATYEDIEKLEVLIEHPSAEVRAACCKVAEKTGCISCEEHLKKLIENEKVNFVKLRALRALSVNLPKASLNYLLRSLEDEWFYMRDFARKMLSDLGPVVLKNLLDFYYITKDNFAKDKIIEIFYAPVNFEYIIKSKLGFRTKEESELAQKIIEIMKLSNQICFYQRLKEEGYEYLF